MRKFLEWIKQEESGQGMVEYGIIVALVVGIALFVFGTDNGLRTAIQGVFSRIAGELNDLNPTT